VNYVHPFSVKLFAIWQPRFLCRDPSYSMLYNVKTTLNYAQRWGSQDEYNVTIYVRYL